MGQVSFVCLFVQACAAQLPEIAGSISGCFAVEFLAALKIWNFVGCAFRPETLHPCGRAIALTVTLSGGALFAS